MTNPSVVKAQYETHCETVYITDGGLKKLTDMSRGELIAALEETGEALSRERRRSLDD